MEIDETKSEPDILHELLTLAEWHQNSDSGLPKISLYNSAPNTSYFNLWRIFEKSKLDKKQSLQIGHAWHLAVGQEGKVIAIIQDSMVEIRTSKDEYATVVGKALIPVDQYPQLRLVQWSMDNTYLAIARDNGIVVILNLLGCIVATIMPFEENGNIHGNIANMLKPVAGLVFLQPRLKKSKWSNELFIFYNNGRVRSIRLSSLECCDSEENVICSLDYFFPQGITAVASYGLHHAVILAGNNPSPRDGLTVWKILNDYPYIKIGSGFEKDVPAGRSFLRFFQGHPTKINQNSIIKMKICPRGHRLACLHHSGEISLWHYPGIRFVRRWPLSQQPDYIENKPQNSDVVEDKEDFLPVDICWWSDSALAIARKSGSVTVCSLISMNNLLSESPEVLSSPRLASVYTPRVMILALECETENNKNKMTDGLEDVENDETSDLQASIQAALYSFTDMERFEPKRKPPRVIQRTYRLLALKCATPEELYKRKVELEEYDSALSLARSYNLDCDLVYQKQWKSSPASLESIYNYLGKIKNKHWVINECIRRVPDDIKTTRKLLEFGLNKTDIAHGSINSLTHEQKQLIPLRRQILSFLDSLTLYQKMLTKSSDYNAQEYDQFRRKSALVSTVDFARQENWLAVSIMLTYNKNSVAKYWLPVLSNFPETLSPLHYRSLLPELNDSDEVSWNTKVLRTPDWSENLDSDNSRENLEDSYKDYSYLGDRTLKHFEGVTLESGLVGKWYLRRVYEIERNSGLVENAYLLACLGRERNVKSLDTVLFHLKSLYTLVYTVQDLEITLTKLESLTAGEQAKLFFSNTSKETFVRDLNNLFYPFAKRYEKRGICTFYSLLHGLLLWLGNKSLDIPLKFFQATKEDSALCFKLNVSEIMRLAIRCIYSCKEPNQLENDYLILECLPARTASETVCGPDLHNTIDKMENHLQVCEILQQYKIFKPVIWVVENKENRIVARQIMQQMANYTRDVTQDFSSLQYDLLQLQSYMFTSYDTQCCNELIASTQLNADKEETILLAKNLIQATRTDPNKIISFGSAVELVVSAAKRHFERATSFDDPSIKLARVCLSLIREPHKHVKEQIDLIEGLRILKDFGVKILPIQVQNCRTKMALIERCLADRPFAYRSKARLIQLADCLRLHPDQNKRECSVILVLAKYALRMNDFDFCYQMCNQLITRRYPGAWSVVHDLVKENKKLNPKIQQEFLAFAILFCPKDQIQNISQFRRSLR